jgi:uncharacterized protein YndB with AHSA1/START domain
MGLFMKIKSLSVLSRVAALTLLAVCARGEVLDSAANGFTVKHSIVIAAERSETYGSAVDHIAQWWNSDHTISGVADNLFITAKPHGCFCERLGPNAGLVHMTVTLVNPGVILRFTGGLGPLGLMGVNGNMTWEFEQHEQGTVVTVYYAVGGYLDGGLDAVAPAVDRVLVEQFERLKKLVETGENQNKL